MAMPSTSSIDTEKTVMTIVLKTSVHHVLELSTSV
jgi:hypothetical protein